MEKEESSSFSLNADVLLKYKLISLTTHKYLSARYVANSKRCWGNPGFEDLSNLDVLGIMRISPKHFQTILSDGNVWDLFFSLNKHTKVASASEHL